MGDYDDFPPLTVFKTALHICPQAAFLYTLLWKIKHKESRISIKRTDVKKKFLISPTLFRNNLLSLSRINILSFEETVDFFLIDFVSSHDV